MSWRPRRSLVSVVFFLALASAGRASFACDEEIAADTVLRGGTLIDGTGAPLRRGDLAIKGDRIVAVGTFKTVAGAKVIDIAGMFVCPGFIDLHSHSDATLTKPGTRSNRNFLAQGVTTVVTGNCGGGPDSTLEYFQALEASGVGTNVIHLVPHGTVRRLVLKNENRAPTAAELDRMKNLVDQAMSAGAWGISTGLIYVPGMYARTDELTELARVVAAHGGIYASHIRDEGENLLPSISEAIAIGKSAGPPVHISHLKANRRPNWGKSAAACGLIEQARASGQRVTADQYPYAASSTSLSAMVIPDFALQGDTASFKKLAADPASGQRLRGGIAANLAKDDGGAAIRIARYPPKPGFIGKNILEIAQAERKSPVDVVIEIQEAGGAQAIHFGMSEDDVRSIMQKDYVATASDGSAHDPKGDDKPHPRNYGTFPRKLRYAFDEHVITIEQAVRSSAGLPARILGLKDRGTLAVGAKADVIVFDPKTFRDAATFESPKQYPHGLVHAYVNGVAAIAAGEFTDKLAGKVLRPATDGLADLAIRAGKAWTNDPEKPWAEGVAARGSKIIAVGSRGEIEGFIGPDTRVLDRPGSLLIPGLIDAHIHLAELGGRISEIDTRGLDSVAAIVQKVKERIDVDPSDSWVIGQNWDQSLWRENAFPTKGALDVVAPKRPVWLRRVDGHAGWANSEAMRRAGVDRSTREPASGRIVRDAKGEPTGVFIDGAMSLVAKAIPPLSIDELERRFLAAQAMVLAYGLTGVHDAGLSGSEIQALKHLDADHRLKLRVYGMALLPPRGELEMVKAPPAPAVAGSRFRLRAIKIFIDGAMGSRGALLFEPYHDDPSNRGLLLTDPELLESVTKQALATGWQVCSHAIGDRGNALVLDAYEKALASARPAGSPRLRIEHAQVVRREDLERFRRLGAIASMQPSHAIDDMRWAEARLGASRAQGAYAWRWFLDAGVPLAFGSDAPVETADPFYGIYAAVTRTDRNGSPAGGWHPEQVLSMDETLRAFTGGSARAAFDENVVGALKPGLQADMALLDRDLFTCEPKAILGARALVAVVAGEVVHEMR